MTVMQSFQRGCTQVSRLFDFGKQYASAYSIMLQTQAPLQVIVICPFKVLEVLCYDLPAQALMCCL